MLQNKNPDQPQNASQRTEEITFFRRRPLLELEAESLREYASLTDAVQAALEEWQNAQPRAVRWQAA